MGSRWRRVEVLLLTQIIRLRCFQHSYLTLGYKGEPSLSFLSSISNKGFYDFAPVGTLRVFPTETLIASDWVRREIAAALARHDQRYASAAVLLRRSSRARAVGFGSCILSQANSDSPLGTLTARTKDARAASPAAGEALGPQANRPLASWYSA